MTSNGIDIYVWGKKGSPLIAFTRDSITPCPFFRAVDNGRENMANRLSGYRRPRVSFSWGNLSLVEMCIVMKNVKKNWYLSIGLLVIGLVLGVSHFIQLPDIIHGLGIGLGIGLELIIAP